MELKFRTAGRDDLDFVSWCNYEATSPEPGFSYWDPILEGLTTDTARFIRTVFAHDALAWGRVEDFTVGEIQNKPVCGASGFRMRETDYRPLRLENLAAVKDSLGWSGKTLNTFVERYQQVWRDPLDVTLKPSGEWTIECVAVLPEWRGKGAGKRLFEALGKRGLEQGCNSMGISVTVGNDAAVRLYEAVGFKPYITYWESYYDGYFPGTAKYTKSLTNTGAGQTGWK